MPLGFLADVTLVRQEPERVVRSRQVRVQVARLDEVLPGALEVASTELDVPEVHPCLREPRAVLERDREPRLRGRDVARGERRRAVPVQLERLRRQRRDRRTRQRELARQNDESEHHQTHGAAVGRRLCSVAWNLGLRPNIPQRCPNIPQRCPNIPQRWPSASRGGPSASVESRACAARRERDDLAQVDEFFRGEARRRGCSEAVRQPAGCAMYEPGP